MENHQISVYVPVTKNYSVNRISVRGGTYNGDSSGLAQWYYTNIDPTSNNIIIHIHGDFHTTFPNDPHLSVVYEHEGTQSQRYHMGINMYGYFEAQHLTGAIKKKKSKKKKSTKKKKKQKKSS